MPDIVAIAQPVYGRVMLQISWVDLPSVVYAGVTRIDVDGNETPVRIHTYADSSGWEIQLSGGLAVLYDTEAPLDVSLFYTTTSSEDTATATSTEIVLASSDDLWLKAPLRPWADQRVVLDIPQEPDCVPENAIFFQSMDVETRPARSAGFTVNNRAEPIWVTRVRASITSSLTLVSRTFTDRDDMIALNSAGDPLLFQGPAQYGIPDRYMGVSDYTITRLSADHRKEWRVHGLPHVEVSRPAGLAEGILGNRWDDLCSETFGSAEADGLTWTQVLKGYGSVPPVYLDLRLYEDIPVDFATYGDIPTGGRTYEDLLEGD